MTVSAISHYRGGTIDVVTPVAKKLKAAYLKHGVVYRLSRFETGTNVGDWLVVVQYADQTTYEKAQATIAHDPECQQALPRLQSSRRELTESWSSISTFDAAGLAAPVRLASASGRQIMGALTATHDAAVQVIDTSVVRVCQHGACVADNKQRACNQLHGLHQAGINPHLAARL
jgi:hypothetical protein